MLVEKAKGVIILCSRRRSAAQTRKPTAHNPRQSFMSPLTWHGPFSFENVCYLVEVDPPHIRQWLQKWEVMIRARQQYRRDAWLAHHAPQASPACPPLQKRRTASAAVTAQQSLSKPNPYTE